MKAGASKQASELVDVVKRAFLIKEMLGSIYSFMQNAYY